MDTTATPRGGEGAEPSLPAASLTDKTGGGSPAFGWRVLGALAVGAVLATCFPPVGMPYLLPLAIAAWLWLLDGVTARQGFYLGFTCGMAWFGGGTFWLTNFFGVSAISLWAIMAVFPALFSALFAGLRRRLPRVPVWLLTAILWTGIEYFRSEPMRPNFGWMGLGYALVRAPVLVAPAAWFGSYFLSFLVVAFSALLLRAKPIFLLGGLLIWRLAFFAPQSVPVPQNPLRVRLVQANSEEEESLFRFSAAATLGEKPDIIVWPEYSFVSDPTRQPKLWQRLARVPQENRCYFLFGAKDQFDPADEAGFRNTAFLLDPQGQVLGKHVKNHPVHFFRDGVAGTEARAFPTALGRLGVAICFDLDYPDVARRLVNDGAEVLLVPSDTPAEWGPSQHAQHRQMFQMRAVECGRWIATADVAGNTFLVAPTGRELQRLPFVPAAFTAAVGRETGRTLFVRGGWRFGQLCLLALLWLCLRAVLPRRNGKKSVEPAKSAG